jgi:hypothetical protein
VTDVDRDVKTLLESKAEEMRLEPGIPDRVLRRARRRRAGTALLAGAITAAAVVGVFAGARLLLQETAGPPRDVRPAGTPGRPYPFIYPPTQAQLDTTIAEVAQGSMPMWTDPEGVATLFAVNVMGWEPEDVEASVRGDDPIMAVITNPALNAAAGTTADYRTNVFMAGVPGSDPTVYAVLAAQAESMELEPVGPDTELGVDGRIAFRGEVSFVPDGSSVVLTVHGERSAPVLVTADQPFEVAADLPAGADRSTLVSVALLDPEGRTLAVTSSRIGTPIAGEAEGEAETGGSEPELAVPPRVAATRDAIRDAAQAHDWQALRALIPDEGFTFSYGGEKDPIRYWKRLESEAHIPIGDILPLVLGSEPGFDRGVFVWPEQATEDPATWDEDDIEELSQIHVQEDIRQFQEVGLYLGWRVGIERDGTWVFFVAGD